jgi:phage terminase small subunit
MSDLNAKQLVFLQEYMRNGGNGKQAAIYAGYSERSADVQASRMLKNDSVRTYLNKRQEGINKDLREIFVEDAVKAYHVLKEIMNDPSVPPKDRLAASRDLLDRAGYKPIDRTTTDITVHSYEDQLEGLD